VILFVFFSNVFDDVIDVIDVDVFAIVIIIIVVVLLYAQVLICVEGSLERRRERAKSVQLFCKQQQSARKTRAPRAAMVAQKKKSRNRAPPHHRFFFWGFALSCPVTCPGSRSQKG